MLTVVVNDSLGHLVSTNVLPSNNYSWPAVSYNYGSSLCIFDTLKLAQLFRYFNHDTLATDSVVINWGYLDSLGSPVITTHLLAYDYNYAHVFPDSGTYNVEITVYNDVCDTTITYNQTYTVLKGLELFAYSWRAGRFCAGDEVRFDMAGGDCFLRSHTEYSESDIYLTYEFGNGVVWDSLTNDPNYVYNTPGSYTAWVYLVREVDGVHLDSASVNVTVVGSALVNAGVSPLITYSGATINLGGSPTATGGTPPYSYSWSPYSYSANPTFTANTDSSTITLTVIDSLGCVSRDTVNLVFIEPHITADFDGCGDTTITICIDSAEFWAGNYIIIGGVSFADCDSIILIDSAMTCFTCTLDSIYSPITIGIIDTIGGEEITPLIGVNNLVDLSIDYDSTCAYKKVHLIANGTCYFNTYPSHWYYNYSYIWDYGDNTQNSSPLYGPMSQSSEAHYYPPGNYIAKVYLKNNSTNIIEDSAWVAVHILGGVIANAGADTLNIIAGSYVTLGGSPTASNGIAPYTYSWSQGWGNFSSDANPYYQVNYWNTNDIVLTVTDSSGCIGIDTIHINLLQPDLTIEFTGCTDSILTVCINNPELFIGYKLSIQNVNIPREYYDIFVDTITTCYTIPVNYLYGRPGVYLYNPYTYNNVGNTVYAEHFDWPPIISIYEGMQNILMCFGDSSAFPLNQYTQYFNNDSSANNTMTIDWGFNDSLGSPVTYSGQFDVDNPPYVSFPGIGQYNITITTHNDNCPGTNTYNATVEVIDGVYLSSYKDNNCSVNSYNFNLDFNCLQDMPWGNISYNWDFGDDSTYSSTYSNWIQHTYQDTGDFNVIISLYNTIDSSFIDADTLLIHVAPILQANAGLDSISGYGGFAYLLGGSPAAIGGNPMYFYSWTTNLSSSPFAYTANPVYVSTSGVEYIVLRVNDYYGCEAFDTINVNLVTPELTVNFSGCSDSTLHFCIANPELFIGQYFNIMGATLRDSSNQILITDTTHCFNVKVDSIYGQFGVAVYNSITHLPMSEIVEPAPFPWPIISYFTGEEFTCFGTINYLETMTNPILWDSLGYHYATVNWGYLDSLGNPAIWADTIDENNGPYTHYPAPGTYNVTITTSFSGCPGSYTVSGPIKIIDGFRVIARERGSCSTTYDFGLEDECFKDLFFENHPEFNLEDLEHHLSILYVFGDGDSLEVPGDGFVTHTYDTSGTYTVYMSIIIDHLVDSILSIDSITINVNDGIDLFVIPDTSIIIAGDSIHLSATVTGGVGPYTYNWIPNTNITNIHIANPVAYPDTVTNYTVTAYDSRGCYSPPKQSVVKAMRTSRPGLSVETSGCPGGTMTICVDNAASMEGMEIHIDGFILSGCNNVIEITESTTCIVCTITSVYGVPSVSIIDPATGLVYNNLIIIQPNN